MHAKEQTTAKKVMVAGHICLDITPAFTNTGVAGIGQVLTPGKLLQVGRANISPGGAVSNTGLAMQLLGTNVQLVAKVGNDEFGRVVAESLGEHGTSLLVDQNVSTSYSVVLALPGVDRIFLHHPGANNDFTGDEITDAMLEGVCHFHFGYPTVMRHMYQNDGKKLAALFRRAKAQGATTSLDMANVDPASPAGQANWQAILQNVLPYVDCFVPSVEETCFMLNHSLYTQWNERAAGGDITHILDAAQDIAPLAAQLAGMGPPVVLLKCGAPGMYYKTAKGNALSALCRAHGLAPAQWENKEGLEPGFVQTNVLSGTGAGDTSIAAFLTAMLGGDSLLWCVKLAAATGACCVASYDALGGLLPLELLREKISAGWAQRQPKARPR